MAWNEFPSIKVFNPMRVDEDSDLNRKNYTQSYVTYQCHISIYTWTSEHERNRYKVDVHPFIMFIPLKQKKNCIYGISELGLLFPIYGKIKMFQTTNQLCIRKNGGVLKWFPHRFKRCPDAWQGCFRDAECYQPSLGLTQGNPQGRPAKATFHRKGCLFF